MIINKVLVVKISQMTKEKISSDIRPLVNRSLFHTIEYFVTVIVLICYYFTYIIYFIDFYT